MAEEGKTNKRRIGLPIADEEVSVVEAPRAEAASAKTQEQARAERQAAMSVAKTKAPKEAAKPAFTRDQARLDELLGMSDEDLIKAAKEKNLLRDIDATDYRVFRWTGNETDKKRGQPISRSKIRSLVVDFLKTRQDEHVGHVGHAKRNNAAEGRVIHAFMMLAGKECHGGAYDAGYLASRRGSNENRGMVARGFLEIIGDNTPNPETQAADAAPTAPVTAEVAEENKVVDQVLDGANAGNEAEAAAAADESSSAE